MLNETQKEWWNRLIYKEIEEIEETIKNEEIFQKGYTGNDINPHDANLKELREYLEYLESVIEER